MLDGLISSRAITSSLPSPNRSVTIGGASNQAQPIMSGLTVCGQPTSDVPSSCQISSLLSSEPVRISARPSPSTSAIVGFPGKTVLVYFGQPARYVRITPDHRLLPVKYSVWTV